MNFISYIRKNFFFAKTFWPRVESSCELCGLSDTIISPPSGWNVKFCHNLNLSQKNAFHFLKSQTLTAGGVWGGHMTYNDQPFPHPRPPMIRRG